MASPSTETLIIPSPKGSEAAAGASKQKASSPKLKPVTAPSPRSGNCLCSPTQHQGSFRCRLHRSLCTEWSMRRSKSMSSSFSSSAKATGTDPPPTAACHAP